MSGSQTICSSLRRATQPKTRVHQQCRNFTSTRRNRAGQGGAHSAARSMILRQMNKEKTMQSRMRDARGSDIPDDFGYFPETLIKPEPKDLPSLLSSKAFRRLKIEWASLVMRAREFGSAVYSMKWAVRKDPVTRKRLKEDMELAARYEIARDLHKRLYQAFAKGDRTVISEIACTGLQSALRARLDHRRAVNAPEENWSIKYKGWTPEYNSSYWLLQALVPPMFKSTRIIADRQGPLPIGKNGIIRQVTVKIRSEQTLDKGNGSTPKTKYVEEYVVIQKMNLDGESGNWMIWGTTQPSTTQEIDEMFSKSKSTELSLMDRFQQAQAQMKTKT